MVYVSEGGGVRMGGGWCMNEREGYACMTDACRQHTATTIKHDNSNR